MLRSLSRLTLAALLAAPLAAEPLTYAALRGATAAPPPLIEDLDTGLGFKVTAQVGLDGSSQVSPEGPPGRIGVVYQLEAIPTEGGPKQVALLQVARRLVKGRDGGVLPSSHGWKVNAYGHGRQVVAPGILIEGDLDPGLVGSTARLEFQDFFLVDGQVVARFDWAMALGQLQPDGAAVAVMLPRRELVLPPAEPRTLALHQALGASRRAAEAEAKGAPALPAGRGAAPPEAAAR